MIENKIVNIETEDLQQQTTLLFSLIPIVALSYILRINPDAMLSTAS